MLVVRPQKQNNGFFNIAFSIDNFECIAVSGSVAVLEKNVDRSFWHHTFTFSESAE